MKTCVRLLLVLFVFAMFLVSLASGQQVTLTGILQGSNGLPSSNYTIAMTPTQWFFIAGSGVTVNTTSYCATSTDGTVVGLGNPLQSTIVTPGFTGTLPADNYYVVFTFYDAASHETLPSPEATANLSSTGNLTIPLPVSGLPAGAVGMHVYISNTSGGETLQGSTVGTATYNQSTPLATGANPPATNTTLCKQVANDAGWPTGTGYTVSLTDSSGNSLPGYPMTWQLLGPNSTINLSNGLPYYHGVVTYPVPILASPLNHAPQSISGPLSLTGYNLVNVGEIGVGTPLPAWGVDVEGAGNQSKINAKGGYLINGSGGTSGQAPCSDGTAIDTFCNFITTGTTFFYQTFELNGTPATQRQALNFLVTTPAILTITDSSSPSRTNVAFNTTGNGGFFTTSTTPGVPTHCANWDAAGNIGDAGIACPAVGINQYKTFTSCVPVTDGDNQNCQGGPISWPTTFADTSYFIDSCIVDDSSTSSASPAPTAIVNVHTKTAAGFSYTLTAVKGSSGPYPYSWPVTCHAFHP